jgi:hypothetical protein
MSADIRYLPVVRQLPDVGARQPRGGRSAPRRLIRLGNTLAVASVALVGGGLVLWSLFGRGRSAGESGVWPLLLAVAFSFGLLGVGCCVTALAAGPADNVSRRKVLSALCISLVAPLAVSVVALAVFFASTSFSFGV